MPTCKKCGADHYNFKPCAVAKRERETPANPPTEYRSQEGWREFGDRLETIEVVGNTYWLKERPKRWRESDP